MTTLVTNRCLILAAYPLAGLALGLADPWLGGVARQLGVRPGTATAVSVNLLLPLVAVVLGLAHARLWAAWLGAAALMLTFAAGLAIRYSAGVGDLSPIGIVGAIPPVLIVAVFGYAVVGSVAALIAQALRQSAIRTG